MTHKNLTERFEKAGLNVEILAAPLRNGRGMEAIFQMDIERTRKGTRRYEKFRIYPGHRDNLVQIRDEDKASKQLVLMVREPTREFDDVVRFSSRGGARARIEKDLETRRPRPKRVRWGKDEVTITSMTPESVRYMLMGVDERQLFVAELTGPATTVAEARRSLGKTVLFADGKRRGSTDRQGEWFFLETTQEVRGAIERAIKKTLTVVQTKVAIGQVLGRRGGNPHTADEIVKLAMTFDSAGHPDPQLRGKVYVRGKIRHIDHKTVTFQHWREVVMNSEGSTATGSSAGVFWID